MTTTMGSRLLSDVDTLGPLPPLPKLLPRHWDAIVLNDRFDKGFQGWHTHTQQPPVMLHDHAFLGSDHALKLSTGNATSGEYSGTTSVYKRLGGLHEDGFDFFGGWIAFRGPTEQASPRTISLYLDRQTDDSSRRSLSALVMRRYVGPDAATEKFSARLSLKPDLYPGSTPASAYVDIPGATAPTYPATPGQGSILPWNVNHGDYGFLGLLVSRAPVDNNGVSGIGRYARAYFGTQVFDLWSLNTGGTWTEDGNSTRSGSCTTIGSGAEPPQTYLSSAGAGAPNAGGDFANGNNVGWGISNKINGPDGPASLFIGWTFACHYPEPILRPGETRAQAVARLFPVS